MKFKFITSFIIFSILILINNIVLANENYINSISINANIEKNNLSIEEIWKGYFYIGTELYRAYNNLFKNDICDYYVIENGVTFQNKEKWNINDDRDEKKQKSSIIENEDGIELCFGIGESGYHEFKIKYTIQNIINQNELYWNYWDNNLLNIEKFNIIINGNFDNNVYSCLKNSKRFIKTKRWKNNI